MWQERFEEMQVKVDSFLIGYKSDFEIELLSISIMQTLLTSLIFMYIPVFV